MAKIIIEVRAPEGLSQKNIDDLTERLGEVIEKTIDDFCENNDLDFFCDSKRSEDAFMKKFAKDFAEFLMERMENTNKTTKKGK